MAIKRISSLDYLRGDKEIKDIKKERKLGIKEVFVQKDEDGGNENEQNANRGVP